MFCFQCEQTTRGIGCTVKGVCGKDNLTAALQDLLIFKTKQIGALAHHARLLQAADPTIDRFVISALFATITNVNFDPARLQALLTEAETFLNQARELYKNTCKKNGRLPEKIPGLAVEPLASDLNELQRQGEAVGIPGRRAALGEDRAGLQELLFQGLKGMAAYVYHAMVLGREDDSVYGFIHQALNELLTSRNPEVNGLLRLCLRCGEINLKVMEMLYEANSGAYGQPEPTSVRIHPVRGKAILVSGHDLKDLEELLKQTAGKGINVYTHGEMLPAHGYPELKKYPHLAGNYGGAWQDQQREFGEFPGAILMTTNCIQIPRASYKKRIFTCGPVAMPEVVHITNHDFTPVIKAALAEEGFLMDGPDEKILVGCGHHAVLSIADKLVQDIKAGDIRHVFLIGGCDGAKSGRDYYTEFAQIVPDDCLILTLACGKYRFNKLPFGTLGGIPRLLDCGQCNDAYSAIQITIALTRALECDVNQLPLSLILSWYEQKAICILLTLLHLGLRNIRLGPSLPACLTPAVFKILSDQYNIIPITIPAEDLRAIFNAKSSLSESPQPSDRSTP